jgi:DNA repair exonuclease SbcCD ATPase subunit
MSLRSLPLLLVAACFLGGEAAAQRAAVTNEEIRDLRAQRARLESKLKELSNQNKAILAKQAEINSTKASLSRLQSDNERASRQLETLQDVERKNPGTIQPEKLRASEEENRRTYHALSEARGRIGKLEGQLIDIRGSVIQENADFEQLRREYESRIDALTDRQVEERIAAFQVKKTTEATGTAACEQLTLTACRQMSQKNAELKASEQGSVVVIDSMTEVKNFKLTKEELRSVVSATLSDVRVLEQKLVNEQYYQTRISATVVPAISPTLRQQLKDGARAELLAKAGGPLDYSLAGAALLSPPPAGDTREDTSRDIARQEDQRRRLEEERRRLEQEREQLVLRQRREEAERIERERQERNLAEQRKRQSRTFTPTF